MSRVAVVGGGVIGCAVAELLSAPLAAKQVADLLTR